MSSRDVRTDLHGILNVDKPSGMTSHDVVDQVRRAAHLRRVGHAGTLDPLASGVLLVCLGNATRVSEYLMEGTKVYRGTVRFGASSTTDDAEGKITPVAMPSSISFSDVDQSAARMIGEIDQVPPIYSAIKVHGKPLYERARSGGTVAPVARQVRIDRIDLLSWEPPDATIDIVCSKGTYIRSVARDLGVALQTGAYLTSLTRLASGQFRQHDAVSLDEVFRVAASGYLDRLLYPSDVALREWTAVVLGDDDARRVTMGGQWRPGRPVESSRLRAFDARGELIALLGYHEDRRGWYPTKVFGLGIDHGMA
jgi:tRNA pseudouridine55 synthase